MTRRASASRRLRTVLPPLLVASVAIGELCLLALYATAYDLKALAIG